MTYPQTPIALRSRNLATSTTRVNDDQYTENGRLLRIMTVDADLRMRWTEDVLRGGDFNHLFNSVWALVSGVADVEGATLLAGERGGPWKESGTSGAVTLNKTSPLSGLRDAKMALDDADTRFTQASLKALRTTVAHTLHIFHLQSDAGAGNTIQVAIRYFDGSVYQWRSGATTWSATETWTTLADSATIITTNLQFKPEAEEKHEVLFRPTAASADKDAQIGNVYIAEDALVSDPTVRGDETFYRADGEGRFSFITVADTGTVQISEVG